MKSMLSFLAALMLVFSSNHAMAQLQDGQQACEGDVYDLCADKIPDEDAIVVCLQRQWSKVSKECRSLMAEYKNNQSGEKRKNTRDAGEGTVSSY